jgi:hypothetical protein
MLVLASLLVAWFAVAAISFAICVGAARADRLAGARSSRTGNVPPQLRLVQRELLGR